MFISVTRWSGSGGTEAYLSRQLFLQCFDAVGWVIWPVEIVLEMTYKVSSGTLNLYSLTLSCPISDAVDESGVSQPVSPTKQIYMLFEVATTGYPQGTQLTLY